MNVEKEEVTAREVSGNCAASDAAATNKESALSTTSALSFLQTVSSFSEKALHLLQNSFGRGEEKGEANLAECFLPRQRVLSSKSSSASSNVSSRTMQTIPFSVFLRAKNRVSSIVVLSGAVTARESPLTHITS